MQAPTRVFLMGLLGLLLLRPAAAQSPQTDVRETTCPGSLSPNGKREAVFVGTHDEYKMIVRERSTHRLLYSTQTGAGDYCSLDAIAPRGDGFENYRIYWAPDSQAFALYYHNTRHSMYTEVTDLKSHPDISTQIESLTVDSGSTQPIVGNAYADYEPISWLNNTDLELSTWVSAAGGGDVLENHVKPYLLIRLVRHAGSATTLERVTSGKMPIRCKYLLADHSLNTAYTAAQAKLDEIAQTGLRNRQRDWIKFRDTQCNSAGPRGSDAWYRKAMQLTSQRTVEIAKSYELRSYRTSGEGE